MIQVIEQEMVSFNIPKHYLPKIIYIMQSGVLDLKGDKGVLHFDKDNNLRLIEYTHKFNVPNLTA